MSDLIGRYLPGNSLLHRIPAGPKLGLVAAWSVLVVATPGWRAATACLAGAVGIAVWARLPAGRTARSMRGLLIMLTIVAGFQTWQRGWPVAVSVVADLLAMIVVALAFTATTRIDAVLSAIERGLEPFRRFGVRPERMALAFSLTLGALPRILQVAQETRAAARARGLERSPRALLVPLAIRTVAGALETGDALQARGLGDD